MTPKTTLLVIALSLACNRASPPVAGAGGSVGEADHEVRPVYPADVGSPDPLAKQLCEALHSLPEARKAQCCGAPSSAGLASECVRNLTGALRATAVTLDATAVSECARASEAAFEGCDWVTPLSPPVPPSCAGVIHGQLEKGARCRSVLECKEGLTCRGASPTQPGVCAPPTPVGGGCGGTADPLVAYTRQLDLEKRHPECAGWCERGRCAPLAEEGQSCGASKQCARGHCMAGKCTAAALPRSGEACFDACEAPSSCLSRKCAMPKSAGETCSGPFECKGVCVSGQCAMSCSGWPPAGHPTPRKS